jgi:hypothetical protein
MKTKRAAGFYIYVIAAIFAIAALALYGSVMYTDRIAYYLLIGAVAVYMIGILTGGKIGNSVLFSLFVIADTVLMALSITFGTALMVNQIGYVIAKLDGPDTIRGFILFASCAVLAFLLTIIAGFAPTVKTVEAEA